MTAEEWAAMGPGATMEERAQVQQAIAELRPNIQQVDNYEVRGVGHAEVQLFLELPLHVLYGSLSYVGYRASARVHEWIKRIRSAANRPEMPITVRETEMTMEIQLAPGLPVEAYEQLPGVLADLDLEAFEEMPRWLEYRVGQGWVALGKDGWGPPPRRSGASSQ